MRALKKKAGEGQVSCQQQTKGQTSTCVLGICPAFPLLCCLCRDGHRCTAQLLVLLGWSAALGLVIICTSE